MSKVGVIDYGVGNIGSVVNMLRHVGAKEVSILTNPSNIADFPKIILPGVGSFDRGMNLLSKSGFDTALKNLDHKSVEILGICLGMQLLTDGSEEGNYPGLGLIPGKIKKFTSAFTHGYPIPHMGWNQLSEVSNDSLFNGVESKNRFYFVHSYYYPLDLPEFVTSVSHYEEPFAASIRKGSIAGVQFHPEKSLSYGKQILKNYIKHD